MGPGDPPWTSISQTSMHPNSNDGLGNPLEQWAIRRWVSTYTGQVRVTGSLANNGCGGQVRARVFRDGAEIFSRLVPSSQARPPPQNSSTSSSWASRNWPSG